jgi:hypothetical protein
VLVKVGVARGGRLGSVVQVSDIHARKLGILATAVVVLAASAAQFINYGFLGERIAALDPGSYFGVFGTAIDIALLATAVSAWVLAARSRAARSVAAVLAGLLTFLAADQATGLHNHIPHWLAFYLPVLAASFICLVTVARGLSGGSLSPLIGVGLVLLALSFFLNVFGPRLLLDLGLSDTTGWADQVKAAIKHGTAVAGWSLIALGLYGLSVRERFRAPKEA